MREKLDPALAFLNTGIWLLPEKGLSRSKAFSMRALKILLLAIRGYRRDQCAMKASALTFYSVLSVVPVIAVFFGIAKGFGFDRKLQAQLLAKFSEQKDVLLKVFEFSDSMLQKTNGGVIAGIGVALLFWSVVKVLGHIEDSFNDIWKVRKPRTFARKCTDYLSITIVCPILFIVSSTLTVTMASQLKFIAGKLSQFRVRPSRGRLRARPVRRLRKRVSRRLLLQTARVLPLLLRQTRRLVGGIRPGAGDPLRSAPASRLRTPQGPAAGIPVSAKASPQTRPVRLEGSFLVPP